MYVCHHNADTFDNPLLVYSRYAMGVTDKDRPTARAARWWCPPMGPPRKPRGLERVAKEGQGYFDSSIHSAPVCRFCDGQRRKRAGAMQCGAVQCSQGGITTPVQGTGTCLHPICLPMVTEERLFLLAVFSLTGQESKVNSCMSYLGHRPPDDSGLEYYVHANHQAKKQYVRSSQCQTTGVRVGDELLELRLTIDHGTLD